jgi:hypothetical protein
MKQRLTEIVFEETQREKRLRDERLAWERKWEKLHQKPWYLSTRRT